MCALILSLMATPEALDEGVLHITPPMLANNLGGGAGMFEDYGDDEEMEALKEVLGKVMRQRKQANAQKQAAVLHEAQKEVEDKVGALMACIAKVGCGCGSCCSYTAVQALCVFIVFEAVGDCPQLCGKA